MHHEFASSSNQPHFSGHESFHLRYGWLKKAYDAVSNATNGDTLSVFTDDEAISRFGVGRNMVGAIRYWATGSNVLSAKSTPIEITDFGHRIFGEGGLDPYLENTNSLWLLHWHLATNVNRTSYFWLFNFFNDHTFTKQTLTKSLLSFAERNGWPALNESTVQKDLSVLLSTYATESDARLVADSDRLDSPLTELGLIRRGNPKENYLLGWGVKPSLGHGTFLYALLGFWAGSSSSNTLSIDAALLDPGSPGRVFLMDEGDIALRLMAIEEHSGGALTWSETAGVRQVVKNRDISSSETWNLLEGDFLTSSRRST